MTSRFEIYDSVARVYSLYSALNNDPKLAEFRFLLTWPEMPVEKKREMYSKYACHELNVFLFKKDPAFFEEVVAPYLRNKYHKTFLDEWLVGAPLDEYLTPWKYARLNVPERILLSQRMAEDRAYTVRHVQELFELLPPNLDRFHHLFSTALLGRSLEVTDALGVTDARVKLADADKALGDATRGLTIQSGVAGGGQFGVLRLDGSLPRRQCRRQHHRPRRQFPQPRRPPARAGGRARRSRGIPGQDATRQGIATAKKKTELRRITSSLRKSLLRKQVRQLYQQLDKTQEWAENNYYHLPIEEQNADLVKVNAFWRDYAQHDPQKPFLSVNLAEASAQLHGDDVRPGSARSALQVGGAQDRIRRCTDDAAGGHRHGGVPRGNPAGHESGRCDADPGQPEFLPAG